MSKEDGASRIARAGHSSLRRNRRKLLALAFWLLVMGGYGLYVWRTGLSPSEAARGLIHFMAAGTAGELLYVALWAVRPLILFPASVLAVAAGFTFGPLPGVALTVIGSNLSASVAYLVGRYFGRGMLDPADPERPVGKMEHYAGLIRDNGFEAVLMVQFAYLPFDLVNYLAGFLRVGWKRFILATFLGSLPAIVAFVLLGSSVSMDTSTGTMGLNPWALLASVAVFGGSIATSRYFRRRAAEKEDDGSQRDE
ncbi:MAG: TVP38/TMEM64 family protein [Rubrobacter sp.]